MQRVIITLAILTLAGCASAPHPKRAVESQTVVRPHFDVDAFAMMAVQYHDPKTVVGVNLYGPVSKDEQCKYGSAAYLAQAPQYMPKSDRAAATCLEIKFTGPVAGGQTVMQPFQGAALVYAIIPIEYDGNGKYLGMGVGDEPRQAIPGGRTADECQARADELRKLNYSEGKVDSHASLMVYCVGIPELDALFQSVEPQVMDRPCPNYPFAGAGPCQIAVRRTAL